MGLRQGIAEGELRSQYPVALRARQILDFPRGLAVRARLETSRDTLLRDAASAALLFLSEGA